jgi:hypothetical protein
MASPSHNDGDYLQVPGGRADGLSRVTTGQSQSTRRGSQNDSSDSRQHTDKTKDESQAKYDRSSSPHGVQQGSILEKIKTAGDEAGPAIIDKVRSAAHRLHFDSVNATGVSRFLNPTNIRTNVRFRDDDDRSDEVALLWRARDSRKGRNSISVPMPPSSENYPPLPSWYTPKLRANTKDIGWTFWKMFTTFPYWDMAFWSGWSYTIGSALFVLDGVFAWGPVAYKDWPLPDSADAYGGPLCFFFGAILYQIGAVAAYLEAVNDGSFHGAAMRRLLEGHEEDDKRMLDEKIGNFFTSLKPHWPHHHQVAVHTQAPAGRRGGVDLGGEEQMGTRINPYMTWRWWPTWHALRTHHAYEMGYLACTIQLFGVTLYGVTGIVVLPGILSSLAPWQKLGAFWVPQVVAAACFLIASLMFMLETQVRISLQAAALANRLTHHACRLVGKMVETRMGGSWLVGRFLGRRRLRRLRAHSSFRHR